MKTDLFGNLFGDKKIKKNKRKTTVKNITTKTNKELNNNADEDITSLLSMNYEKEGTKKGLSKDHIKILKECQEENSGASLRKILSRTNSTKFMNTIIKPLIKNGYFVMTNPDSPKSPKQKYRLTGKFVKPKK